MKAFDWEQIEMHLPTQTKVSIDFGQPHYTQCHTQITTDDIHVCNQVLPALETKLIHMHTECKRSRF